MLLALIAAITNLHAPPPQKALSNEWIEAATVNVAYQMALCQPHLSDWLGTEDVEISIRDDLASTEDEASRAILLAAISASQQGKKDRLTTNVDAERCAQRVGSAFSYLLLPNHAPEPTNMFRPNENRESPIAP